MQTQTLFIQGGQAVHLSDQDFIAQGGEGCLYMQGAWVYKIYTNPQQMPPAAKIQELRVLSRPNLIVPDALLLDTQQQPVGIRMAHVPDSVALPRLFTNDYRHAQRIDNAKILCLLQIMQESIAFIHAQGCLLVDGNEMNYLLDKQHTQVYFIDTDSYQTPSFPATAIMPSIRDYHTPGFSTLSDWFAFAIVACQLLIGIHPYKGKHPQFNKQDLAARMRANMSIFNPQVSLPAAARDFSLIPPAWRDWFERLFEQGERQPPPPLGTAHQVAQPAAPVLQSSRGLQIQLLRTFNAPIHGCQSYQGHITVFAGQQAHLEDGTQIQLPDIYQIFHAELSMQPILASLVNQQLQLHNLHSKTDLKLPLKAEKLLLADNHLFCVNQDKVTGIKLHELKQTCVAAPGASWHILPKAHQVLNGILYQNVLGEPYVLVPYQAQACALLPVPELQGYQVLDGKYEAGVAMLLGYRQGRYALLCLRFSENFQHYQADIMQDVEQAQVNFVALDNGVVVQLLQEGELQVLHRSQAGRRVVKDAAIRSDMRLCKNGTQVLAYQGERLYALRLS